jgi:2-C-methyl-D-erythritol 4-phosphate cytidylyltransferase
MAQETPKAFISMGGLPLFAHTLRKFEICPQVQEVVLLVPHEGAILQAEGIVRSAGFQKVVRIIPGGAKRQDSVYLGLKTLDNQTDIVLVHDGARPFVPVDLIRRIIEETRNWKSVVAAIPVRDTIKEVAPDGRVCRTLNREPLWEIQTPQGFLYSLLVEAYERAQVEKFYGTDDAALIEHLGLPVKVIQGDRFNIKITTPEDLTLGETILGLQKEEERGRR